MSSTGTPVNVISRAPRVYRYLDAQYVDQFFSDGTLRLSSFGQFARQTDEQRLDTKEGRVYLIHRTWTNGGQTLVIDAEFGQDAYVLSSSLAPSKELMSLFQASSAIIIHNPLGFMCAVAAKLRNVRVVVHGPCSYQNRRAIEKDLGYIDFGTNEETSDSSKMNAAAVLRAYSKLGTEDLYFIKAERFRAQAEYRFLWLISTAVEQYIEIHVPEARQFCYRREDQGEWVAF